VAAALTLPPGVSADAACDARKSQVETLQKQLQQLQETLKQYEEKSASPKEVEELRQEVAQAPANSVEWKNADSVVHLAGYGDATQQCGGISGG
jgi:flagellar motility protein MotE (MotC chaperone)